MSETTMREGVLWEFTYDAGVHRLCRVSDMADEILRLRDEINRLTRILAALREPSDAMRNKVIEAYFSSWDSRDIWTVVIHAAVAAAEQEVS